MIIISEWTNLSLNLFELNGVAEAFDNGAHQFDFVGWITLRVDGIQVDIQLNGSGVLVSL